MSATSCPVIVTVLYLLCNRDVPSVDTFKYLSSRRTLHGTDPPAFLTHNVRQSLFPQLPYNILGSGNNMFFLS